tara:strand:- start:2704 stop:3159 length:456 start_codon:yes stop_codon:yes gene_type:complete
MDYKRETQKMKITKTELKKIIKEEIKKTLKEYEEYDDEYPDEDEESDWDKISKLKRDSPQMALMLAKVSSESADILSRLKRWFNEKLFNDNKDLRRVEAKLSRVNAREYPNKDLVAETEADIAKYKQRIEKYESLMSQIPEEVEIYRGTDY